MTDTKVSKTGSVDSANSDDTYRNAIGRSRHDASFQPHVSNGGADPSGGDILSRSQPPLNFTAKFLVAAVQINPIRISELTL